MLHVSIDSVFFGNDFLFSPQVPSRRKVLAHLACFIVGDLRNHTAISPTVSVFRPISNMTRHKSDKVKTVETSPLCKSIVDS